MKNSRLRRRLGSEEATVVRPTRRRRSRAAAAALTTLGALPAVGGHGYLASPRSRNLVAYQDANWEMPRGNDPQPEDCPHCLNRGGTLARCGILFGTLDGVPFERNYDVPLTTFGQPMAPNIQGVYQEGGIIEVEVLVTTHHKGHFAFGVCPIVVNDGEMEVPTEECFAKHPLAFISDELYGAPPDPTYPERGYLAPASHAEWSNGSPGEQPVVGARYRMKFRLPAGVVGDVVLLQWHYLTANSCKHPGYAEYPFPEEWGEDVALYGALPDCGAIPEDGDGVPEQFWNCAEIAIVGSGGSAAAAANDNIAPLVADAEPQPTVERVTEETHTPCADATSSYFEATADCSGYVHCTMGVPDRPYSCGPGQLYDQLAQRCNWADEVNCHGEEPDAQHEPQFDAQGNPSPTKRPTPAPTNPPNPLYDWDPNVDRGHDKTIIGYYASWQWYDRDGLAEPMNMDFSKITRANFAFFQITEQGDIYGTDAWADPITLFGFYDWMSEEGTVPTYCSWDEPNAAPTCSAHNYEEGLIYLAHQAGAEVYPSIGGWSLSEPFPAMAASATARAHFAQQCVELIKNYNFDGIDLDWEYPGYEPHAGTPADTGNFNLLLDEVRAALDGLEAETGKYYGLTAALPCGPSIIDNQDIAHVSSVLTELNLMTYDFHGSWNDQTGVNAPLYDQNGSPDFSVHGCVANWLEGGATKEKINIGFPFYGRSFLGAQHLYEAHEGNDESTWHMDEGVPQYYNILDKMSELTSVRDDQTMTQYAYGETGMVSYDDERAICDKTEYAQVHGFNGYIIWELSGDLMPDLSTPLLDTANAKLLDPSMDCANLDLSSIVADTSGPDGGANAKPAVIYYPDFSASKCLHDGLEPAWMQGNDLHTSLASCCDYHFNWSADCVEASDAIIVADDGSPGMMYYPSSEAHECLSDGKQPDWVIDTLYDNPDDCCSNHYGWIAEECIDRSIAIAGTTPVYDIAPVEAMMLETAVSNQVSVSSDAVPQASFLAPTISTDYSGERTYYPLFASDGTTTCQNVGTPPSWMTGDYLRATKSECCRHFAFESDYDKCFYSLPSYYPNYRGKTCKHDGDEPSWMVGDYLSQDNWQCCSNSFQDEKLLQECYEMPSCADCPSDMNDFYAEPEPEPEPEPVISLVAPVVTAEEPATSTPKDPEPQTADDVVSRVESVLKDHKSQIDDNILIYQRTEMEWAPSDVYRYDGLVAALQVMHEDGVAGKYFYMGDNDSPKGHLYGLVNIAAFLAQSMKETIKYNACDENSWDPVGGGYPLSNACGQLGQSYQDYHCSESEKHMECPVKSDMEISATTNAKWWGAPAPLFCGPKTTYPSTGYWDHSVDCNNQWLDPPTTCDVYEGQKGGAFNHELPTPNGAGRTDVEGCCWWGRGVIQTTGVCNYGKLNYYLGAKAAEEGRSSRFPDVDFCEQPNAICDSEEHKELKWLAGLFYWVESLQSYNVGGWYYIDELKKFVDNGMSDGNKFIDAVSGVVNRGCHNPPCASGGVDGGFERAQNFLKVLQTLGLV